MKQIGNGDRTTLVASQGFDVIRRGLGDEADLVVAEGDAHRECDNRCVETAGVHHGIEAAAVPVFLKDNVAMPADDERARVPRGSVVRRHL